jgi:hypothetical protein
MRLTLAMLVWIAAASALAAGPGQAQTQPMSQRTYSNSSAQSYGLPEALPQQSAAAKSASGNIVKIPIPGGGQVTVEGPAAPVRNPLPPLGGDTWAIHQNAPYGSGTGPLGP